MLTFYNQLRNRDNTVLLIRDSYGKVFGSYCTEKWHPTLHFYGTGEAFVFTFDEEDIQQFSYTQSDEQIQFSDEKCIIVGGGTGPE